MIFWDCTIISQNQHWVINYYRFWSIWTHICHFLSEKWSKILCPNDFRSWKLLSPVQSVEDFLSPFGGLFFWESLQTNENFEFQPTKYLLSCRRMSDLNSIHEAEYLDHLIKINLPRRILIVHPERPPSSIKLVHSFFSTSWWEWSGHQSCSKMMCACLSFSAGSPLLLMSVAIINSWNNSWEHLLLWYFSFWLMFLYLFSLPWSQLTRLHPGK